jgi:Holliday junction DNA helicase RuvA
MIGKLKGLVDSIAEDYVILDVQGVGYVVQCASRTLQGLPKPGEAATLSIETQVREDAIRLYGFGSDLERDWFRLLQNVQGVGGKVALALLGLLGAADLARAIALQDKTMVARAPGVGPKLAARIVAELKDKAPASGVYEAISLAALQPAGAVLPTSAEDAVSALINLGYARPQAVAAVAAALQGLGSEAEVGTLIRQGLKELAK